MYSCSISYGAFERAHQPQAGRHEFIVALEDSARDVSIASLPKCRSKEKGEVGLVGAKGLQIVSHDLMQGFVIEG